MESCNAPNTNAARAWNCNCGTIRITSRPSRPHRTRPLAAGQRPVHPPGRQQPRLWRTLGSFADPPLQPGPAHEEPPVPRTPGGLLSGPAPAPSQGWALDAAGWLSQRLGPPAGLELDAPPGLCPRAHDPATGRPTPRRGPLSKKLFLMVFWLKLRFPWL